MLCDLSDGARKTLSSWHIKAQYNFSNFYKVAMSPPALFCDCVLHCLHPCQPDYEQACLCAYVSIFAHLRLSMHVWLKMASRCVILCNTVLVLIIISPWACSGVQSATRGAFGSVGEVLEAAWPRCAPSFPLHRVPGTACTAGKPSLTTRLPAQPTPCLNRAGGCHVMLNTHMQEGLLAHANAHLHASP